MILVHVMDRAQDLLQDDRGLPFTEMALVDDFFEQLPAGTQLHDKVRVLAVVEGLEQLDDVRMVEPLHDGDFLSERPGVDVLFRHLLDGPRDPGPLPRGPEHRALRALALLLPDVVLPLDFGTLVLDHAGPAREPAVAASDCGQVLGLLLGRGRGALGLLTSRRRPERRAPCRCPTFLRPYFARRLARRLVIAGRGVGLLLSVLLQGPPNTGHGDLSLLATSRAHRRARTRGR
mmetsp:Transcript_52074/g.158115  ORF Transcript_52074/g.158115 Transcript_52074/m.158115 type:complete len:233 (+) Transcript_52074:1214-1912(+)